MSEYTDVLKKLQLNLADILKQFGYSADCLPQLLTLLNALLKKEMETMEWERLLEDYSEYPFVTPAEVTQGDFTNAVDALFLNHWYDSYYSQVENRQQDQSAVCAELKTQLLTTCFPTNISKEVVLRVPIILDSIDNCNEPYNFDYKEISQVDIWWNCDIPSRVPPDTTIPSNVLQMEQLLCNPVNPPPKIFLLLWSKECPLRIEDKLAILCPRKRTIEGSVVMDMMNVKTLRDSFARVIKSISSIDDLVSRVISNAQKNCKSDIEKLQKEFKEAEKTYKEKQKAFESQKKALERKREDLVKKYTQIAKRKTEEKGKDKNYDKRNENTIRMLSYLHAVNNIREDEVASFLNNEPYQQHEIRKKVSKYYRSFDFQMIFIPKNHKLVTQATIATITLSPPDGVCNMLRRNRFQISNDLPSYSVTISDGYLLVLPLAPFKWNVTMHIDEENAMDKEGIYLAYYTNTRSFLSQYCVTKSYWVIGDYQDNDWEMYFILNCLKCMKYLINVFELKYVIPISQQQLGKYNRLHNYASATYTSSMIYFYNYDPYNCEIFMPSYSTSSYYYVLKCSEIRSSNDILPFDEVACDSYKTYWSYYDFINGGYDLNPMYAYDTVATDDVNNYNKELENVLEFEKQVNSMKESYELLRNDLTKKKKEGGCAADD